MRAVVAGAHRQIAFTIHLEKAVLLYFGYANSSDVCALTLFDITSSVEALGGKAQQVRVL